MPCESQLCKASPHILICSLWSGKALQALGLGGRGTVNGQKMKSILQAIRRGFQQSKPQTKYSAEYEFKIQYCSLSSSFKPYIPIVPRVIRSNNSQEILFRISCSENWLPSAKLRKSLEASTFQFWFCVCFKRRGLRKVFVQWRNYLSNMAPTSALCTLCIQPQCVITMSLHSYIVIAEFCLFSLCFQSVLTHDFTW